MTAHPYLHLDVFTRNTLSGNQLAVFPDPPVFSDDTMQSIAREMNFSETTFVYPPVRPGSLAQVRIFTPGGELPMAGHPTIGTTFALAALGRIAPGTANLTLDLGVGPHTHRSRMERGEDTRLRVDDAAAPDFRANFREPRRCGSRSWSRSCRSRAEPADPESCRAAFPWVFVALPSREAVDRAMVDRVAWQRACTANSVAEHKIFVFSIEDVRASPARLYSRMFAPVIGIAEDPGTGGASGPLGSYLVRHGVSSGSVCEFVSHQGVKMQRACEISIRIGSEGDEITRVQIGGTAVVAGEATLRL